MATFNSRIPLVETSLIVAIAAVGLYAFVALRSEHQNLPSLRIGKQTVPAQVTTKPLEESLKSPFTFEAYQERFEGRDIFSEAVVQPQINTQVAPDVNVASGVLAGRYKVVGILLSENPEAVIEDASTHQTFFLKEGQEQSGMTVKKIQKGSVLIDYMGQPHELRTQPNDQ